ncbi:F-box protein-like [Quillaja saponaria]|uniref:F-box protein-like n=1 Tax=Quillaja saponaria TaxID=32244 RepID=A0AAD7KXT5_QUISA|nr:F-box protein-like [Quillaja saponaria]
MKNPKQYCRRLRKGIQMHKNIFLIEDSHIPDWLLVEVFVRLPVKSVFMCKCVSKRWLSLISEPFFVQLFISKRTNKMDSSSSTSPDSTLPWTLLFRHKSGNKIRCTDQRVHDSRASVILYPEFKSPSFSLSFLPLKKNNKRCFQVEAVASSNGLLLCCSATMPGGSRSVLYFYICNPFTMKWIVLPDPPSNPRFNMDAGLISQDDGTYKVVRMVFVADHSSEVYIYFEVFCSRTGAWSVNKVWFPFKKGVFPHKPPTNYRGILHWLEINNRRIIAYNPYKDTSQCRFICLPKDVYIFKEKLIGISCGCLCYIELVHTLNAVGTLGL